MFKYYVAAAVLLGLAACQTSRPLSPAGIYATAAAFRHQQPSLRGAQVAPAFAGQRHVFVQRPVGSPARRLKVAADSIWGYCRANGVAYRIFQHRTYKIRQADTLIVYSVHSGKTTHYYFSNGLTGPVQQLVKKKLQAAFAGNPAFIRSLDEVKWYQRLEGTELHSNHQNFRVVALYRQSLQPPH